MKRQHWGSGAVCLLTLGLLGCESRLSDVRGQVSYRGQPLAGACVCFVPTQGQIATGVTNASGQFTLQTGTRPGAAVGSYKVCVTKFSPSNPKQPAKAHEIMQVKRYQGGIVPTPPKSDLPNKYGHPQQSGLAAVVTGDPTQAAFTFVLTD